MRKSRIILGLIASAWTPLVFGCGGSSGTKFNPTPVISAISPGHVQAGGQQFQLTVTGLDLISTSVVDWNGAMLPTKMDNLTGQLIATVTSQDIALPGTAQVTIVNPPPGGGTSFALTFFIDPIPNPVPSITSLSPPTAIAGGQGFTLTINGLTGTQNNVTFGFIPSSTVYWNGSPRTSTFVNSGQLTAQITSADIASPETATVSVTNPAPGGGTSTATFTITSMQAGFFPQIVSQGAGGTRANGTSVAPQMDWSGRFVAFLSGASNLVESGASGSVFLRDTCLGAENCTPRTVAVDIAEDGSAPNGPAGMGIALSADGRFVAFSSRATNLVPGADRPAQRIYLRDTCLGVAPVAGCVRRTMLVSVAPDGAPADGSSDFPSVAADGRYVAFTSAASNLIGRTAGAAPQIYLRDTCQGAAVPEGCVPQTILVTKDSSGEPGNRLSYRSAVSADGRYVAFDSSATNFAPGIFDGVNVFVRDTCRGAAVGCVPSTNLVSATRQNRAGNGPSLMPSISADGRFVAFASRASDVVSGVSGAHLQILLRDTCLGAAPAVCVPSTALISMAASGRAADGDSGMPFVSATGRFVSFASEASNLGAGLGRGVMHVYVRDTCRGEIPGCLPRTTILSVSASGALGNQASGRDLSVAPISGDGRFVSFFSLATNLSASGDPSGAGDIYEAVTPF